MEGQAKNILFVGVGGQGIVLASEIAAEAMVISGYDVKKSEIHGMAQRGGSVSSHLRYGRKVYSPIIKKGEGDILLSFELIETLRWIEFLKRDSLIIVNNQQILFPALTQSPFYYSTDPIACLKLYFKKVVLVNGLEIAVDKLKERKVVSTLLLGKLSQYLPIDLKAWEEAIKRKVPPKSLEVNLQAFRLGRDEKYV